MSVFCVVFLGHRYIELFLKSTVHGIGGLWPKTNSPINNNNTNAVLGLGRAGKVH